MDLGRGDLELGSSAMTYELGVDVSKWQVPEKLNWRKLRDEAGVRFVIARHTCGLVADATFWRHGWRAMRAGGVQVGAYQYLSPHVPATAQVSLALQVARELELPYVLDVEAPGLTAKHIDTWLDSFTRSGLTPMIYCSQSSWRECYGAGPHRWAHLPLWVANYTKADKPAMPDGWSSWQIWQHTDNGALAGFDLPIDCNRRRVSA